MKLLAVFVCLTIVLLCSHDSAAHKCIYSPATDSCVGNGFINGREVDSAEMVRYLNTVTPGHHVRRKRYVAVKESYWPIKTITQAGPHGFDGVWCKKVELKYYTEPKWPSDSNNLYNKVRNDCFRGETHWHTGRVTDCEKYNECIDRAYDAASRHAQSLLDQPYRTDDILITESTVKTSAGPIRQLSEFVHYNLGDVASAAKDIRPTFLTDDYSRYDFSTDSIVAHGIDKDKKVRCHTSAAHDVTVGTKISIKESGLARIMFKETRFEVTGRVAVRSGERWPMTDVRSKDYSIVCSAKANNNMIDGAYWLEYKGVMSEDLRGWPYYLGHTLDKEDLVIMTTDSVSSSADCLTILEVSDALVGVYHSNTMRCYKYDGVIRHSGEQFYGSDGAYTKYGDYTIQKYNTKHVSNCFFKQVTDSETTCFMGRDRDYSVVILRRTV